MSIRKMERVIGDARTARDEWASVELGYWREIDTRYTFVDPMLGALGWKISDPKECYPEYPRGDGAVDYALFRSAEMEKIGRLQVAPDIVIESKKLRTALDGEISQLRDYVKADPPMRKGLAVLTNGGEWRIYRVTRTSTLAREPVTVDILNGNRSNAARDLNRLLCRRCSG